MAVARFVVIVLCANATLDDLIREQKKAGVIAVEVLRYEKKLDYLEYRRKLSARQKEDIMILFIFGENDVAIVKTEADMSEIQERLVKECIE